MKIALVHPYPNSLTLSDEKLTVFKDIPALVENGSRFPVAWVNADNAAFAEEKLYEIRRNSALTLLPVFLDGPLEDCAATLLADGTAYSAAEVMDKAATILEKLSRVDVKSVTSTSDLKLLVYLYSRPNKELVSWKDWTNEHIHSFSLVEVFNDSELAATNWLDILCRRGLLTRTRLLDRVRHCPQCHGCHHNFVDVCPEDNDINIEQIPFIHCFTCGHVAPEGSFYNQGIFLCPNCGTKLRHIGADYDRPMENYRCQNGHTFAEPAVVAFCLHCGACNKPADLVARQIHAYGITGEGRLAAKAGDIRDIYAVLDDMNYLKPDHFFSMLDWLINLNRRHSDVFFSLLGLRLLNVSLLVERLGRVRAMELMDEFAERLRSLLRGTDITTRTNETDIWILLPKTSCPNCHVVGMRIRDLQDLTPAGELSLEFRLTNFSVPEDAEGVTKAKQVMALMASDLSRAPADDS